MYFYVFALKSGIRFGYLYMPSILPVAADLLKKIIL